MYSQIEQHITFLINGGLDPKTADRADLRLRRMLAGSILAMTPVLVMLISSNIYYGASKDNAIIVPSLFIFVLAVYLQAYRNAQALAGNLSIVCYYYIPTALMTYQGLMSTALLWILPLPVFAILVNGARSGFIWCGICVATIASIAYAQATGFIIPVSNVSEALTNDIETTVLRVFSFQASLILLVLTAVTSVFQTTRKQAEEQLTHNIEALESEVKNRRLAERAAKDSEVAKTAFFAAMGHEIRTPLNGVIGATRLLEVSNDDAERKEYTSSIVHSGEILLELINNVLDLSSLEAGKVELESMPFELRPFINQTMSPFQVLAKSKGISLATLIDDELPAYVLGDPTRVRQILINLVGNAIKFTELGKVELELSQKEQGIEFIISDSGIGVPEKSVATLFEPYVQADISINRKYGGSGLGLSIVHRLIVAMDGCVNVQSKEGVGTTFTVLLPLNAAHPEESEHKAQSLKTVASLKILVVDDNAINRMVLSKLLAIDNNEVVEASSGADAIVYLEGHIVDLVLMDIQMPEMDGLEATRCIRNMNNENSTKPIIAITANNTSRDKEIAKIAGMNGFITKPFKHEELVASLAKLTQI